MKSVSIACLLCLLGSRALGVTVLPIPLPAPSPCDSAAEWDAMRGEAERTLTQLRDEAKLPPVDRSRRVLFEWPLRAASGFDDPGYHAVVNFVDHDPAYPDRLLDYECGDRTYDTAGGVNHNGTDYVLWPFWWYKMDHDQVEVVAAAAGTIFGRTDGHDDRSCSPGGSSNKLAIRHADGTRAWYLHLKKGSLTPKEIGDSVVAGEYLGIVGSSGNSGLPHLHFDVRDEDWNTFDPYEGPCNESASGSWWADQRPYYDSAINVILTHSAPPVFPPCPEKEILHRQDEFAPPEVVFFGIYHRDLLSGQVVDYAVLRPDGSVADGGSYAIEDPHYPAAYALASYELPGVAPAGTWKIVVDYEGQHYERPFGVEPATGVPPPATKALAGRLRFVPNPFSSATTILTGVMNEPMRAQIFDGGGRRVRTLVAGETGGSGRRLVWDGCDRSGRKLPAGTYFVRVRAGNETLRGRVLLLR